VLFGGKKRPVREVYQSNRSSADVQNEWSYTSASPICFYGVDRENFIYFYKQMYPLIHARICARFHPVRYIEFSSCCTTVTDAVCINQCQTEYMCTYEPRLDLGLFINQG
jgi:hypothetical protein